MKKTTLLLSGILALTIGCASIVSKNTYPVSVTSSPSGATVTITDSNGLTVGSGLTPQTITLRAKSGFFKAATYDLEFKKDGYQTTHSTIRAGLDGWYLGNIIFGGLIGILIVDPATGSMWKLPNNHSAVLSAGSANNSDMKLEIKTLSEIPDELRKTLVKLN